MLTLRRTRTDRDLDPERDPQNETPDSDETGTLESQHGRGREPTVGTSWTTGQKLSSTIATAALWGLIICGPVALIGNVMRDDPAPPAVAESQDVTESQNVAQFAGSFMTQYLTTPRGQEDQITGFFADGVDVNLRLPDKPTALNSVTPGATVKLADGEWLATVAVELPGEGEAPAVTRYWQVPVLTNEHGQRAVGGLPSLVASPATGDLAVERSQELSGTEAGETVTSFLRAYLTGQGDVQPLTAPDVVIAAVDPPPFTEISTAELRASEEMPEAPAQGDSLIVHATVSATAADGSTTQLGYSLELRFRDRWEVAAINPTTEESNTDDEGEQQS